jgi:recombination protein RecR
MQEYTQALAKIIEEFKKFPGIGPKSAQRMAFSLLKKSKEQAENLVQVIRDAKNNLQYCNQCFNLTTIKNSEEERLCEICSNPKRDALSICVIEDLKDLLAIERSKEFKGHYHILGGLISPLDGVSVDDLNIKVLIQRIEKILEKNQELELILGLGLSTEGEATILYLKRLIQNLANEKSSLIKTTRLAYGLPVGADLDYVDESSLAKAIGARVLC